MRVDGIGPGPPAHAKFGGQPQGGPKEAAASQGASASSDVQKNSGEAGRAKGVIRLLQEGHFKGVADVRLRINFADELNALSQSSLRSAVSGDASTILAAVETQVSEFLASGEFDDAFIDAVRGAQATFESRVNDLAAAFEAEEHPDSASLLGAIQSAFDEFVSALTAIFTPDDSAAVEAVPDDGETAVPVDGESEPAALAPELQSFLDRLTSAFESALSDFGNGLSQAATILPPLSEPNGNGAAYEKFLAILNGLGAGSEPAPDAPEGDLDTAV